MNKLLVIIFICLTTHIYGQSTFSWVVNDTMVSTIVGDEYAVLKMEQNNEKGDSLLLGVEVVENDIPSEWDGMVCVYGKCLTTIPDEGTFETMWPLIGDEKGYVRLTVSGVNTALQGKLRVRVYDLDNVENSDTATWIVTSILDTTSDNSGTDTINSINEVSNGISVYPNPSKGKVFIDNSFIISSIEVYNVIGKRERFLTEVNSESTSLRLEKGIYFIVVRSEKGKYLTKRVIINE